MGLAGCPRGRGASVVVRPGIQGVGWVECWLGKAVGLSRRALWMNRSELPLVCGRWARV